MRASIELPVDHSARGGLHPSLLGNAALPLCGWFWCIGPRYAFNVFTATKQPRLGVTMTDWNRSFGAELGIVVVLIAVTALAAMLAP
jgi:hypothetical protein